MADQRASLTFLADPLAYQAQSDEICIRMPGGIVMAEELSGILARSLPLSQQNIDDWNSLYDALRSWDDWQNVPRRVVIVHSDLPLAGAGQESLFDLKIYLEILIESISALQERNAAETDPARQRELMAIFPAALEEQVQHVLNSPPPWDVTLSFFDYDDFYTLQIDPSWSTVLQYLSNLNGVTSEICTLSRADLGSVTIHYNRHSQTYCALYTAQEQETWMVATEKEAADQPVALTFEQVSQVLEAFFVRGERLDVLNWSELSASAYGELLNRLKQSYYRNDEDALIEKDINRTRSTIGQGIREAVESGEEPYSLTYWQETLVSSDSASEQRLAALCAIGLSTLPEAPALLRPFLHSEVKQERWVSARFRDLWQNDEALPMLLNMLIDELPLATQKLEQADDYYWYNDWRRYTPRLLRKWRTPEVDQQLRRALTVWVQAEARFDPDDIELWELYEGEICYELGYRGDFTILDELPLQGEHKQALFYQLERGKRGRKMGWSASEEYQYR